MKEDGKPTFRTSRVDFLGFSYDVIAMFLQEVGLLYLTLAEKLLVLEVSLVLGRRVVVEAIGRETARCTPTLRHEESSRTGLAARNPCRNLSS
jgi:hypothetical protein